MVALTSVFVCYLLFLVRLGRVYMKERRRLLSNSPRLDVKKKCVITLLCVTDKLFFVSARAGVFLLCIFELFTYCACLESFCSYPEV